MTTLILQHTDLTTPGRVVEILTSAGRAFELRHLHRGAKLPDAGQFDSVIVLGGGVNVDQDHSVPYLRAEKEYLRAELTRGTPLLGLCLGAQLIADALGANVQPHPRGWEVGWHDVECLDTPGVAGFTTAAVRRVCHYHRYVFDPPAGARTVARNAWWPCQGFAYGDHVLALQFHPERTLAQNRELALEPDLPAPGPAAQSARDVLALAPAAEAMVRPWFRDTVLGWLTRARKA